MSTLPPPPIVEDDPELEQAGHSSLPVRVPSLDRLTNPELIALRNRIHAITRKARKDASKALCKEETVKTLWLATLGNTADREHACIEFEAELLRHPDAFLVYAWANALTALDQTIRAEMVRRSALEPARRRR